ncbi:VOC family protein [Roseomonas rosulenta]|uniref:VOC family protein n=1 Tax=Roseomonas rosulenta TaxID=2748667 RepID=UPI0018DF2A10|nr:VOC family protein [Roseomonas rosulenta]
MTPTLSLDAVVIPCRDVIRQRAFYERILERPPIEARAGLVRFDLGALSLVLRARGDALFPREGTPGVMLTFRLPSRDEVERWHRRLLMAHVAVLDAPAARPGGGTEMQVADPEGNVLVLAAAG